MTEMREVFFPYCLKRQPDGRYAILNRRYKPVGLFTGGWVKYDGLPVLVDLRVTPSMAASVSWDHNPKLDEIFLYDDGCVPTASTEAMAAYLDRVGRMMKWKIRGEMPRKDVDPGSRDREHDE
ncbi:MULTISPECIES: hypothetical protein [Sorangium]|uniref:Uncharacterized protein n=1 Tax=Sorangium cellulosum (strain So ce56) TaxID=448385 RepID=A9G943_SORC5|nr:hypothetical protein [Sorangium cellulosum]CAN99119.1 hypothetical protein predicted by Glimmer/Critica [Sorangium cellulosum So ce56]